MWNESSNKSNIAKVSIPYLIKAEKEISQFGKPILLQNGSRSSILIFSSRNEEIKVFNNSDKSFKSLLSRHILKEGFNKIDLNYNVNSFKNVTIFFSKSDRTVCLK